MKPKTEIQLLNTNTTTELTNKAVSQSRSALFTNTNSLVLCMFTEHPLLILWAVFWICFKWIKPKYRDNKVTKKW